MLALIIPRDVDPWFVHLPDDRRHSTVRLQCNGARSLFAEEGTYRDFDWSGTIERYGRVICEVFHER